MRKLQKMGDQMVLVLSEEELVHLNLGAEAEVTVSLVDGNLVIQPAKDNRRARLLAAADMVEDDHAEAFEKLA